MIPYLHTQNGLSFVIKGRPVTVSSDAEEFAKIKDAILGDASEGYVEDLLNAAAAKVAAALQISESLKYKDGNVLFHGEPVHNYVVDKIIELHEAGEDVTPLTNFLEKLSENPSQSVFTRLYAFLEKGEMPLTQDGNFLAYKAVRANYTDIHSGTFDNFIGSIPTILRREVNDDHGQTCSNGLHVCSYTYLPHFSHAGGHVMVVEIDPADVVAIPTDYNDAKMRVCKYKVIGEVEGWYAENTNPLAETPVNRDWSEAIDEEEETFSVVGDGETLTHWGSLDAAKDAAIEEYEIGEYETVTVLRNAGLVEVFSIG